MKLFPHSLVLTSVLLAGTSSAQPLADAEIAAAETSSQVQTVLHDWVAKKDANLCGIAKLKRVTNPAVVDYESLMKATPQIIEMKGKGIKPDSIEGKTLREAARKLIVIKAQVVQKEGGYCGLWRSITHKDGRDIDDVSAKVIALF